MIENELGRKIKTKQLNIEDDKNLWMKICINGSA